MTEIDWLIVGLLVLSSGVGITRGVVREILAIVGWVAGIMLALAFSGDFADMIPLESLGYLPRVLIASILLIVAALFCVGLLGLLIRKLLEVAEPRARRRLRFSAGRRRGVRRGLLLRPHRRRENEQSLAAVLPHRSGGDGDRLVAAVSSRLVRFVAKRILFAALRGGIPLASGRGSQRIMRKGVRQARPFLISFHKAIGP